MGCKGERLVLGLLTLKVVNQSETTGCNRSRRYLDYEENSCISPRPMSSRFRS
jgi:hypothetical protein